MAARSPSQEAACVIAAIFLIIPLLCSAMPSRQLSTQRPPYITPESPLLGSLWSCLLAGGGIVESDHVSCWSITHTLITNLEVDEYIVVEQKAATISNFHGLAWRAQTQHGSRNRMHAISMYSSGRWEAQSNEESVLNLATTFGDTCSYIAQHALIDVVDFFLMLSITQGSMDTYCGLVCFLSQVCFNQCLFLNVEIEKCQFCMTSSFLSYPHIKYRVLERKSVLLNCFPQHSQACYLWFTMQKQAKPVHDVTCNSCTFTYIFVTNNWSNSATCFELILNAGGWTSAAFWESQATLW